MDRPEDRGSLKVVSTSERDTGAFGTVGGALVPVAVGGTGVDSAAQASAARIASAATDVVMKGIIHKA